MMVGSVNAMSLSGLNMVQRPSRAEAFKQVDANSDGSLDTAELSVLGTRIAEMTGQNFDLDAIMNQFDRNQDGLLDQEEAFGALDELRARGGGAPPPPDDRGKPPSSGLSELISQYLTDSGSSVASRSILDIAV